MSHGRSRRTRQLPAIEFLWDAFEINDTHCKYQFAFLAYHMLTMSLVYFNIWRIKQTEPKDFAIGLIGFGKDIEKSVRYFVQTKLDFRTSRCDFSAHG